MKTLKPINLFDLIDKIILDNANEEPLHSKLLSIRRALKFSQMYAMALEIAERIELKENIVEVN